MSRIKYFVMDVDGTLTDGKIYIGQSGELFKVFSVKDGYGIHDLLPPIIPVIITSRKSDIVKLRCMELDILEVYQGVRDKLQCLRSILERNGDGFDCVAYIGDDLSDLECMSVIKQNGGLVGCPCDAVSKILEMANFSSKYAGGNGAVREFVEWIKKVDEGERHD